MNTAPVKARGFLWACVSLCAFCWREGSSQLIDTELSMKRTKRSPSLPWLASLPERGLPAGLRLQMKHTHTEENTHICARIEIKSDVRKYTSPTTSARREKKKKERKRKINQDRYRSRWSAVQFYDLSDSTLNTHTYVRVARGSDEQRCMICAGLHRQTVWTCPMTNYSIRK